MNVVKCGECGQALDESSSLPEKERRPCPNCGSIKRGHQVMLHETVTVKEKIGTKARHGAQGKPYLESIHGDDLLRKTGEWNTLDRVINRDIDLYSEIIKDKTGKIIHKCEEPLSKHTRHGSAKKKIRSIWSWIKNIFHWKK